MSKSVATLDRIVTLIVALVMTFIGVWAILYFANVPAARELAEYRNSRIWLGAPEASWFDSALIGMTVIFFVVGLWLVLVNLRRERIKNVVSESASTREGSIAFNLAQIASAVANDVQSAPNVTKVSHLVAYDRGRPTLELTVQAEADCNVASLVQQLSQAERDIRDAIGDVDVDTSFRVHLDPVDRTPELVRTD